MSYRQDFRGNVAPFRGFNGLKGSKPKRTPLARQHCPSCQKEASTYTAWKPIFRFFGAFGLNKGKRPCNTLVSSCLVLWFYFPFCSCYCSCVVSVCFPVACLFHYFGGCFYIFSLFVFSFFFNTSSIWVHSFCFFNLVVFSTYCFLLRGLADSDGKKEFWCIWSGLFWRFLICNVKHQSPKRTMVT